MEIINLSAGDLKLVRGIEDDFISQNPINDYPIKSDDNFWKDCIFGKKGLCYGFLVEGKLLGFSPSFIIDSDDDENINRFKKYGIFLKPNKSVWLMPTLILPEARGYSFQYMSRLKTIDSFTKLGVIDFATTIPSDNFISHSNISKAGFNIIGKEHSDDTCKEENMYYYNSFQPH